MNVDQTYLVEPSSHANRLAYAPRSCRHIGIGFSSGIQYKMYAIWSDRFAPADIPNTDRMIDVMATAFAGWNAPGDHSLGFAILHLANDGTYLLLLRWNNGNNLRHRVFRVDLSEPVPSLSALDDPHTIACVWEMRLIKMEVDAWVTTVLLRSSDRLTPEMARDYLSFQFEGTL